MLQCVVSVGIQIQPFCRNGIAQVCWNGLFGNSMDSKGECRNGTSTFQSQTTASVTATIICILAAIRCKLNYSSKTTSFDEISLRCTSQRNGFDEDWFTIRSSCLRSRARCRVYHVKLYLDGGREANGTRCGEM